MAIERMDNVLIVVDDIDVVAAFFVGLGLTFEGKDVLDGAWVERVIGLEGVHQEVAVLRTPDGRAGVELVRFHTPAAIRPVPWDAPTNTLGMRRVMFAVDDIDATVARAQRHGARLVGSVEQYEGQYRLCYLRGPEHILVGLAQQLTEGQ